MDIKEVIANETGIKTREIRFLTPPGHPYIVFNDENYCYGSDNNKVLIINHTVSLELYTKIINQDESSDKVEKLILDTFCTDYRRCRELIESEEHYLTVYDFEFLEKKRR